MKHYGDITRISGYDVEPADVVTGGSPCQDLSIAGKRAGLAGARSGLFMEQIRVIKEMRDADIRRGRTGVFVRPRFMVWENVPGAFSSNGGNDFKAVLEETIRVAEPDAPDVPLPAKGKWPLADAWYGDGWSVAYRVLDAQFWGVPQRRRRIALVADFGGRAALEILFVRQGVQGDLDESGAAREEAAGRAGDGADRASEQDILILDVANPSDECNRNVCPPMCARMGTGGNQVPVTVRNGAGGTGRCFNPWEIQQQRIQPTDGIAPAISAAEKRYGGIQSLAFDDRDGADRAISFHLTQDPITGEERAPCLSSGNPDHGQASIGVLSFKAGNGAKAGSVGLQEEIAPTLSAAESGTNQVPAVYDARGNGDGKTVCTITGDHENRATDYTALLVSTYQNVTGTLNPGAHPGSYNGQDAYNDMLVVRALKAKGNCDFREDSETYPMTNGIVRRLTPLECERLQGYPDGWTDIGEWTDSKGKKHKEADAPRYKALGNSIALPPWTWVLKRIAACYERPATLASLFDGIGGFPLIWERLNGKGTALWASEIEEFPIAVTRARFPEGETV